jgi:hypothetical protein
LTGGQPAGDAFSVLGRLLAAIVATAALAIPAAALGGATGAWQRAADRLDMPVLAPTVTGGLTLKRVVPKEIDCGAIQEELDAYYSAGPQRKLRIAEGKPFYCGDIGDAPLLSHPRVHGKRADLYEYCEGTGCRRATHRYLLTWRERGIQIVMISRGTPQAELLVVARSMTLVADTSG